MNDTEVWEHTRMKKVSIAFDDDDGGSGGGGDGSDDDNDIFLLCGRLPYTTLNLSPVLLGRQALPFPPLPSGNTAPSFAPLAGVSGSAIYSHTSPFSSSMISKKIM